MREADGAFGDPTVFVEEAVIDPRHIEVQILADGQGNVIHLFERDCSVQRRHQKVVEIAPAPHLDPELRDRICADAVAFASEIGYVNAGTVEFLRRPRRPTRLHRDEPAHPGRAHGHRGGHRRRPGAVAAADRRRRDAGRPRAAPGQRPDSAAPPCSAGSPPRTRPTASAPTPAGSRRTAPRAAPGVRLDGGTTYTGAEVSAHFDSMLTKLTCRGRTFEMAVDRARRAVAEFRIRGVATNIPFLQAVLDDPDFRAGRVTTVVHRGAPAAADRALVAPTAAPGCCTTSPTSPSTSRTARRRPRSTRRSKLPDARPRRAGHPTGSRQRLRRARARGVRAGAARADRGRGHRHDVARRPPVAARHPGAHPRPASPSPGTSPG